VKVKKKNPTVGYQSMLISQLWNMNKEIAIFQLYYIC